MNEWCWTSDGREPAGTLLLVGAFLAVVFGIAWNFLIDEQEYGLSVGPSGMPPSHRGPGKPIVRNGERRQLGWRQAWNWVVILTLGLYLAWGIATGRADWASLTVGAAALSFLGIVSVLVSRFGLRHSTARATLVVVRGLFAASLIMAIFGIVAGSDTGRAC